MFNRKEDRYKYIYVAWAEFVRFKSQVQKLTIAIAKEERKQNLKIKALQEEVDLLKSKLFPKSPEECTHSWEFDGYFWFRCRLCGRIS